jgi:hypothetical protein
VESLVFQSCAERDVKSLTTRFQRHIAPHSPNIQSCNRFLRQVKREKPSGTPEEEYIDLAIKKYEEATKKSFSYKSCVPILQDLPNYDPMCSNTDIIFSSDDEGEDSPPVAAVNYIGAPM